MYYVNEDIKNCVRVFPEQGRYDYARYDMNENPEGLPQWFVDEVLAEITIRIGYPFEFQYCLSPSNRWSDGKSKPNFRRYVESLCSRFWWKLG